MVEQKLVYQLCLSEKVHLIEHFNDNRLLNKRNEFMDV